MSTEYIQRTKSLMRILETSILENWDCVAYEDYGTDVRFTYADVARAVHALHARYRAMGLEAGDRIALCDRNSSRWAVAFLSALTYGAVAVPVLHDFSGEQVANILRHSEARLLIGGDATRQKLAAAGAAGGAWAWMDMSEVGAAGARGDFGRAEVRYFDDVADDLAMLSYTSGSTGNSKGVMLPYRSIWSNVLFADERLGLARRSRVLSLLPLAHMYGFAFEFFYETCIGCRITFLAKAPSPSVLLQAFADVRPDIVVAVPLIVEKVVQGRVFPMLRTRRMRGLLRIPGVRALVYRKIRNKLVAAFGGSMYEVIVGGAALNSEVEAFLRRIHFPYTVGYGMTECGPIICYQDWRAFAQGSCGVAAPRMEVRIDSADPGRVAGEILARGANVMLGYYKNDAATAAAIDEEGWLHTGDLGTMDARGNVFIRGRSKNMLLGPSGQNIYPEEIEEKLVGHALIDECVVVQRGTRLVGLVHTSDDTLRRHGMTRADFAAQLARYRDHVNALLPPFYRLAALEARDEEFEKTPKRNIKRYLYV